MQKREFWNADKTSRIVQKRVWIAEKTMYIAKNIIWIAEKKASKAESLELQKRQHPLKKVEYLDFRKDNMH